MRAHTRLVSFILMHKWPCELKLLLQPIWVSSLVYHIFEAITISFLCVMLTNSHISPGVYDYTGDLFGESEATRRYQDTVGVTEISYRRGEYFTYLGLLLLWKEAYNQSASLCEQGKHLGGGSYGGGRFNRFSKCSTHLLSCWSGPDSFFPNFSREYFATAHIVLTWYHSYPPTCLVPFLAHSAQQRLPPFLFTQLLDLFAAS